MGTSGCTLWSTSEIWYSHSPDFTVCFHETALPCVPAAFIFMSTIFNICSSCNGQKRNSTMTLIGVLRLVIASSLMAVHVNECSAHYRHERAILWPSLVTILGLICTTNRMMKTDNVNISLTLLIYWTLFLFSSLATARSVNLDLYDKHSFKWIINPETFIRISMYPVTLAMFVLIQIRDTPHGLTKESGIYEEASVLSRFTYYWMLRTIFTLRKETEVTSTDHLANDVDVDSCETLHDRFERHWNARIKDAILWPLFQTFRKGLISHFLCKAVEIMATLSVPVFGDLFLSWLIDRDAFTWHVYLYVVLIFLAKIIIVINAFRSRNIAQKFSLEMRALLTSKIHQKILKMSPLAKVKYTSGQLSTLAFTDPERLSNVFQYFPDLMDIPITTSVCLYLLWRQLGSAAIVAAVALLALSPLTVYAKGKLQALQSKVMEARDSRAKLISEMLNNIKTIKLYAWETPLAEGITKKRHQEVAALRGQMFYLCLIFIGTFCVANIASNVSFLTFCLVFGGVINPSNAFVSFSLFHTLQERLKSVDIILIAFTESRIARKRLTMFLNEDEYLPEDGGDKQNDKAIEMTGCSFSWSEAGSKALHDINLTIKAGSLTAIIGSVASGKSSLASAILGDMRKLEGTLKINGDLAYVPQTSWIQNATVKKNITFTSPLETDKYAKILSACALEDDLRILPAGDETEIGERGINLSGGQKQRVSLARAVYSDRDIYLLDDTLSAVDANVGNHLFEHVIGQNGLLRNKTRVFITHKLDILPHVDDIIVMKAGLIDFHGSYESLTLTYPNLAESVIVNEAHSSNKKQAKGHDEKKRTKNADITEGKLTTKETMDFKSVMWKVFFRHLASVSWEKRISFVVIFAFRAAFEALSPLWLSEWALDSENPDRNSNIQLRNVRIFVFNGIGVCQALSGLAMTYLVYDIASDASVALHAQMLSRILRAPMSFFDTTPIGRILNRFTSDVYSNDATLRVYLRSLSINLFAAISCVFLIILKTPLSVIAIVMAIILNSWAQNKLLKTARQLQRLESTTRSLIFSQLSETISGSSIIRSYHGVMFFNTCCDEKLDSNNVASYCRVITRNFMRAIGGSLGAVVLLFSLALVLVSDLDAATAGIVFSAVSSFTDIIVQGYERYAQVDSSLVAVERCQEYTSMPVEENGTEEFEEPHQEWPQVGTVSFKSYSTKYRPELDLVLNKMDLQIDGGKKIGIVGRTGAGKSSIPLALFRIIEAVEGQILIDSVDCTKIRLVDLRSRMCIIPQEPVLFMGSLRYNLDPFNRYGEVELWRALEIAHLKDFVNQLPGGLCHEISEDGENISVGQRQLVCLARAVLKKSKILILDEATAAIDNETDEKIQQTIRTEFSDCTILTIAHRLTTILDYDRIIVMDNGTVAEYDEPNVLLERKGGLFHKLAKDAGLL
ncbi:Multidrug resistance-associated protein 1 [Halotydeus destructor]|nr:Multidrug resistance-associated protein 1 [Halotydeus destructor]